MDQADRYLEELHGICLALATGKMASFPVDIRPGTRKARAGSHMVSLLWLLLCCWPLIFRPQQLNMMAMSPKAWRLSSMVISLRSMDLAFACTASMPRKVAKHAVNAMDRPGGAGRRRQCLLPIRSVEPPSCVSISTRIAMDALLQDALVTAKT